MKISTNMIAFRNNYPEGKNHIVASDIEIHFEREYNELVLSFVNTQQLIAEIINT